MDRSELADLKEVSNHLDAEIKQLALEVAAGKHAGLQTRNDLKALLHGCGLNMRHKAEVVAAIDVIADHTVRDKFEALTTLQRPNELDIKVLVHLRELKAEEVNRVLQLQRAHLEQAKEAILRERSSCSAPTCSRQCGSPAQTHAPAWRSAQGYFCEEYVGCRSTGGCLTKSKTTCYSWPAGGCRSTGACLTKSKTTRYSWPAGACCRSQRRKKCCNWCQLSCSLST
jgi:hypothetical protein